MTSCWPDVPLGDILAERKEVPADDALSNGIIRIVAKVGFSDGRIQFRADGQTKTGMILIRPGDLVISGINAAKGAIAVYDEQNIEPIAATIHYGAYIPNKVRVDVSYLWWLLRSRTFRDLLLQYVPGGIKTELKAKRLLPIPIPLPPLEEQRRILARIDELATKIEEARGLRRQAAEDAGAIIPSMASKELAWLSERYKPIPLLDLCDFEGGSQPPKSTFRYEPSSDYVRFLQIRDYSSDDYLTYVPASPRNRLVTPKEVLIGRYGASLGKVLRGKEGAYNVAMCKAVPKNDNLDLDFLAAALAYGPFQERLKEISRSAQVGFNKGDLRGVEYSFPPIPEQRRIVVHLEGLQEKVDALKRLQAETAAELDAMLPSILDKAFRGSL